MVTGISPVKPPKAIRGAKSRLGLLLQWDYPRAPGRMKEHLHGYAPNLRVANACHEVVLQLRTVEMLADEHQLIALRPYIMGTNIQHRKRT